MVPNRVELLKYESVAIRRELYARHRKVVNCSTMAGEWMMLVLLFRSGKCGILPRNLILPRKGSIISVWLVSDCSEYYSDPCWNGDIMEICGWLVSFA
ncbi:hypothetical protein CDAR_224431 [Caerostris darwini]|uniref:Uncharacterized protein n=1 Tax=Caerostris darwini TaxID=1538125 RepID=A0AAV4WXC4_9ARAC|nr:hypothetical protein CDAR_224431 [Caerostris darwini]